MNTYNLLLEKLPTELINIISLYDYSLLCFLHNNKLKSIQPKECSIELLYHCIQYDYIKLVKYIISVSKPLTLVKVKTAFDTAVLYNSINSVEYICSELLDDDNFIAEYIPYSIENKYFDITFYLLKVMNSDISYKFIQENWVTASDSLYKLSKYSIDPIENTILKHTSI